MFQTHLVRFLPQPYNQSFLQGSTFLLLENGGRNQDLDAKCAHCYWGVTALDSQQKELRNVFVC